MRNSKKAWITEILICLLSFFTVFALINKPDKIVAANITHVIIFCFVYAMYRNILYKHKLQKITMILSMLFAFFIVVGYSYQKTYTLRLITGSLNRIMSSIIIFIGVSVLFYAGAKWAMAFYQKHLRECKGLAIFNRFKLHRTHPVLFYFIIILILWSPYIIAYFPGMITPDANIQLAQYYGLETTKYTGELIGTSVSTINGHHPVLITLLFGFFFDIGNFAGSPTLGLALYVLLQCLLSAFLFAKIINYLNSIQIHPIISFLALLCYALLPFFPLAAMTMVKDSLSIIFFLLFCYCIIKISRDDRFSWLAFCISIIGMALSRKEYIYIILLMLLYIILSKKNIRKKALLLMVSFVCFYNTFDYIVFNVMEIPEGSRREMLSVPFQQTARLAWTKGNDVYEEKDKDIIRKVLDFDQMKRLYKPVISDPVKATFNEHATKEDLNNYFKVWLKYGLKYPTIYINATISNTFRFFYPNYVNQTGYFKSTFFIEHDKFKIKEPEVLKPFRSVMTEANHLFTNLAPFHLFLRIGSFTWLLIGVLFYLFTKRKFANLLPLLPFLLVLAVCLISPSNGNLRYSYGMIFGAPLILAIGAMNINNKKDIVEKLADFIMRYREIAVYLVVGILTTIVSILSYYVFSHGMQINYLVANFLSWICAVIFAYFTNKVWVFQNHNFKFNYIGKEFVSFTGSRVLTLIIDMLIMFIIVSLLHMNDMLGKIIVQVVVTILNYVFSKFFVFKTVTSS